MIVLLAGELCVQHFVILNSGCVTSAETVLITAQSTKEFQDNLNKGKTVIVSLSPQSRASLAAHFKLSILQVCQELQFMITLYRLTND